MIHASFPELGITAATLESGSRTIAGTAVPYGVPGTIADGRTVVFEPGSLDPAARPLLLRDHDRTRPLGRVIDAADRGDRLDATAKVSQFREGDDALVLAADGVLGAFSVGAEPTDFHTDVDGVLHVAAADWHELSLLTFGAYDTARVTSVTAQQGENMSDEPTHTDPDDDDDDDVEPNEDIEPDEVQSTHSIAEMVPITAATGRHPAARNAGQSVNLLTLGRVFADARAGNARARQQLRTTLGRFTVEAALSNVTMVGTDNVGGSYRPAYQPEIVDIVSHGAPTVEVIRQGDLFRGDFPNKTFLQWTKTPKVALQATEKTAVNSTAVALTTVSVPVKTWATGNDISQQILDFGPPDFLQEYVRAASADYATVIDTYAITALLAAATAATTALADNFQTIVQKMYAALDPTKVPAGRLFLVVGQAIAAGLIGVTAMQGPAFWGVNIDLGNYLPDMTAAGIAVIVDSNMPANTYLLGMTNAATWYDVPGVPFTLQAVEVGNLGLDIAVYGYGALGVQYPGALVKTTPA